jgi:hypothetical protein
LSSRFIKRGKIKAHKVRPIRWNGKAFRLVRGNRVTTNHMGIDNGSASGGRRITLVENNGSLVPIAAARSLVL